MALALKWSDNRPANEQVPYNHCECETPFGRFLLTWKGWKDEGNQGIGFDETPWGENFYGDWWTVEEAKQAAEDELLSRMVALHAMFQGLSD